MSISDEIDDGDIGTDVESSAQHPTIEKTINGSRSENDEAALDVANPNSCDLHCENTDINTDNSSQMKNAGIQDSNGVSEGKLCGGLVGKVQQD